MQEKNQMNLTSSSFRIVVLSTIFFTILRYVFTLTRIAMLCSPLGEGGGGGIT
jgi:hypothetical protein